MMCILVDGLCPHRILVESYASTQYGNLRSEEQIDSDQLDRQMVVDRSFSQSTRAYRMVIATVSESGYTPLHLLPEDVQHPRQLV